MKNDEIKMILNKALPFWNNIDDESKLKFVSNTIFCAYKKGDMLHKGQEDCSGLFLIKSGVLRVYIMDNNGKEITLYRLFENDICLFSASCMLKNINFEVFISAEEKTEIFLIPNNIYFKMAEKYICIADFTNQILASRFSDVMWIMEQIIFMSFDKRLAIFLEEQSNIKQSDILKITHDEIARNLGTAREVVTRMLKYFSDESVVKLSRGVIEIKDRKKLLSYIKKD